MLKNINCLALALRNGKIERMLSIVVPVFNEEEAIGEFFKQLSKFTSAILPLNLEPFYDKKI